MDRDSLGIYIPQRTSTLSDEEILSQIQALQARRGDILAELSKEKVQKARKPKKEKVLDLSKMDKDDVYTVLAAQMGMTVDEFKRLANTK